MARKLLGLVFGVVGVGLLASATPVVAHHSVSAEFDTTKTISFTGKVKEVNWGNPHIYTSVETTDPDSKKPIVFRVEGGAPNALFRAGWRKDTLKIGETVKVTGNRAKNPESTNIGQATILNEAGKRVYAGNAAGNAAQP
jgi:Family of unknown function (DUF6152)